ncbi:flavin monoamine oxidase family protein [Aquimarina sp. 2304DJ70-9]|uniref:flavin monoamine oxidase family protein n=1 Tax=Aquimarina penaris TaxID=3231044 RepID=UPI0034624FAB
MKSEVIIIGAGLTGLLLAYRLKKEGISFKILESRNKIGGRINTVLSGNETTIEMGATWLGTQHQDLLGLLDELNIPVFEQYMKGIALFEPLSTAPPQKFEIPDNQEPSFRIQKGSETLIHKLATSFNKNDIILNSKIHHIDFSEDQVTLYSGNTAYLANKVVSTLPPMLLVNSITCNPALPTHLVTIANNTHTWMGESIKFGVSYTKAFWRENNFSGTVFSNVGPITELYDHSNYQNDRFALKGFLQNEMYLETTENRKTKVFNQLQKLFGDSALDYLEYEELVWKNEQYTTIPTDHFIFPHQNNGHSVYQQGFFNNSLFIGGTETAVQFGGYMEGAVKSAQSIYQKLKQVLL